MSGGWAEVGFEARSEENEGNPWWVETKACRRGGSGRRDEAERQERGGAVEPMSGKTDRWQRRGARGSGDGGPIRWPTGPWPRWPAEGVAGLLQSTESPLAPAASGGRRPASHRPSPSCRARQLRRNPSPAARATAGQDPGASPLANATSITRVNRALGMAATTYATRVTARTPPRYFAHGVVGIAVGSRNRAITAARTVATGGGAKNWIATEAASRAQSSGSVDRRFRARVRDRHAFRTVSLRTKGLCLLGSDEPPIRPGSCTAHVEQHKKNVIRTTDDHSEPMCPPPPPPRS